MIHIHATTHVFFAELAKVIAHAIPGPTKIHTHFDYTANGPDDLWITNWMSYVMDPNYNKKFDNYIIYQTEKIVYKLAENPRYPAIMDGALEVYDYSPESVKVYPRSKYVPMRYSPVYDRKKYDVLFYGSMTPRREVPLQQMRDAGLNVKVVILVSQAELEQLIDESKIILSHHFNDCKNNDGARIIPLISRNAIVVAETSDEPEFDAYIAPYVHLADYDKLAETCVSLIYKDPFVFPIPEKFRTW